MDTTIRDGWIKLSLPEQMVNIGNEVKRAVRFDKDYDKKRRFIEKALEYVELTIADPKNSDVVPELEIGKRVLEDYIGKRELDYTKEQLQGYYLSFMYMIKH